MLGLLGAAIFGVIYYGAWASADDTERKHKNNNKEKGISYYTDKKGIVRYTNNGKKYDGKDDNLILIGMLWRQYKGYSEIYKKYQMKYKTLEEWIKEKYPNSWEYYLNLMKKYENYNW